METSIDDFLSTVATLRVGERQTSGTSFSTGGAAVVSEDELVSDSSQSVSDSDAEGLAPGVSDTLKSTGSRMTNWGSNSDLLDQNDPAYKKTLERVSGDGTVVHYAFAPVSPHNNVFIIFNAPVSPHNK